MRLLMILFASLLVAACGPDYEFDVGGGGDLGDEVCGNGFDDDEDGLVDEGCEGDGSAVFQCSLHQGLPTSGTTVTVYYDAAGFLTATLTGRTFSVELSGEPGACHHVNACTSSCQSDAGGTWIADRSGDRPRRRADCTLDGERLDLLVSNGLPPPRNSFNFEVCF